VPADWRWRVQNEGFDTRRLEGGDPSFNASIFANIFDDEDWKACR
jgi:uncharacterized protein (DUF736 family)